ncbi:MAG: hypothetical protein H0U76_18080 [Ktedonobacteraceae bacterium]|nr:hypothetical protein [Ktedonobacteraceae bacterium]
MNYINLTSKAVTNSLREVAEYHGYASTRGPHAGKGNVVELALAIGSGEIATILLPDEERSQVIRWLDEQAKTVDDPFLGNVLKSLAKQLHAAVEREYEVEQQEMRSGDVEVIMPPDDAELDLKVVEERKA